MRKCKTRSRYHRVRNPWKPIRITENIRIRRKSNRAGPDTYLPAQYERIRNEEIKKQKTETRTAFRCNGRSRGWSPLPDTVYRQSCRCNRTAYSNGILGVSELPGTPAHRNARRRTEPNPWDQCPHRRTRQIAWYGRRSWETRNRNQTRIQLSKISANQWTRLYNVSKRWP